MLKVVVAPSGFKESLGAEEVAHAITRGIRRASGDIEIVEVPLVDGGEGFTATLTRVTGGETRKVAVTGPLGDPVDGFWGLLGGAPEPTAVIEIAAAAGLRLVPRDRRDPLVTTTYGVGELIGIPVIAIVGRIGPDAHLVHEHGVEAYFSALACPCTLDEAITRTAEDVTLCAEHVMRTILIGRGIAGRAGGRHAQRPA